MCFTANRSGNREFNLLEYGVAVEPFPDVSKRNLGEEGDTFLSKSRGQPAQENSATSRKIVVSDYVAAKISKLAKRGYSSFELK
jgi:hypothetical protein